MIYDIRQYNSETRVHLFSDLEACYDRQIPEIDRIIEESTGVDRKAIQLIIKTVETFAHFVRTGFRISKRSYGEKMRF